MRRLIARDSPPCSRYSTAASSRVTPMCRGRGGCAAGNESAARRGS